MSHRPSFRLTARGRVAAGVLLGVLFLSVPAIVLAAIPSNGYLEICKAASGPGVSGSFDFTVGGRTVSVPVGACSAAIQLPSGTATVTEAAVPGVVVTDVGTGPSARLVSRDLAGRSARVSIAEGDVSSQTIVTFTNAFEIGQLKVCKVAGPGVVVGTNATFIAGSRSVTVPAGPAPGGFCGLAGNFPAGTSVDVTEVAVAGTHVSDVTGGPADRISGVDLVARRATVAIGPGATEVTFTNEQGTAATTTTIVPLATTTTVPGGGVSPSTTVVVSPTSTTTIPAGLVPTTTIAPATTTTTLPGGGVSPTTTVAPTSSTTIPGAGVLPTSTVPGSTTTTVAGLAPTTTAPHTSTTAVGQPTTTVGASATTTTTAGPGAGPTSTVAVGTTPTSGTPGSETVRAASLQRGPHLARTGRATARLALWGLSLLLLGAALVRGSTLRPTPALPQSLSALWSSLCRPVPVDDDQGTELRDDLEVALADPPFLGPSSSWSSVPLRDRPPERP